VAPELVAPEPAGRTGEADVGQVVKKRLDSSGGVTPGLRKVDPTWTTLSATFPPSSTCSTGGFMVPIVPPGRQPSRSLDDDTANDAGAVMLWEPDAQNARAARTLYIRHVTM
jgi:hypothetical protein